MLKVILIYNSKNEIVNFVLKQHTPMLTPVQHPYVVKNNLYINTRTTPVQNISLFDSELPPIIHKNTMK